MENPGSDPDSYLVPAPDLPDSLSVALPEYNEVLAPMGDLPAAPDFTVPSPLLVQEIPLVWDLDADHSRRWH